MRSDHLNKHMKTHQRKVSDTMLDMSVDEVDEENAVVTSSSGNDIIVSCECTDRRTSGHYLPRMPELTV